MQQVTLRTHARYSREEILAALDWALARRASRSPSHRRRLVARRRRPTPSSSPCKKTERDFSPTTMYRDYALSPELFHWESQNATSVGVAGRASAT